MKGMESLGGFFFFLDKYVFLYEKNMGLKSRKDVSTSQYIFAAQDLIIFLCGKEPAYQTLRQWISWASRGRINTFHSLI